MSSEEGQGAAQGAATGAAVGSVVPGWGTAIGAGVGAVAGYLSAAGGSASNRAAARAAKEREDLAKQMRAQTIGAATQTGNTVRELAKASPQELATMQNSLDGANAQLEQRKRLLAAVDPSIMEASKQILGLLRGDQTNGAMSSFAQQRDQQRQQLLNQIRAKYGPGGESTAGGAKMLRDFDMAMNAQGVQVGQGQLSSLTGLTGALTQAPGDLGALGLETTSLAGTFKNRQIDAEKYAGGALINAMNGTSQQVYDSAGSSQLGAMLAGRQQQQMWNSFMQTGATMAGSYYGARGEAQTPDGGGGGNYNEGKAPAAKYDTALGNYQFKQSVGG